MSELRRRTPAPDASAEEADAPDGVIDYHTPVRMAYNPVTDPATWLLVVVFAAGQLATYELLRRTGFTEHIAAEHASLLIGALHCFFTVGTSLAAMCAPGAASEIVVMDLSEAMKSI